MVSLSETAGCALLVLGDLSEAQSKNLAAQAETLPPAVFALPQAVPAVAEALGLEMDNARFFKLKRGANADGVFDGLGAADLYFKQWLEAPAVVGGGVAGTEPAVLGHVKVGQSAVFFCGLDSHDVQGERQRAKALRLVGTLLTNAAQAVNAQLPPLDLTAGTVEVGSDGSPYALQALTYNPYKYRRW